MAGTSVLPSAAASATAEPEMPAKNTLAITLTWPRPPLSRPSMAIAKSTRARVMPARFMISPARMNSGIAISANTSIWLKMRCGTMARYCVLPLAMKASTEEAPSAYATAVPARQQGQHRGQDEPGHRRTIAVGQAPRARVSRHGTSRCAAGISASGGSLPALASPDWTTNPRVATAAVAANGGTIGPWEWKSVERRYWFWNEGALTRGA